MSIKISDKISDSTIDSKWGINNTNWDHPAYLALSQKRMNQMMPVTYLEPVNVIPLTYAQTQLSLNTLVLTDPLTGNHMNSDDFLGRRLCNDALLVFHRGQVVHESYRNGMAATDHHVLHSTTKSLTAMLIGIALDEEMLSPLADIASYIPELKNIEAWSGVTVQHVMDMATGIQYEEEYTNPNSSYFAYARAVGYSPADISAKIGHKAWMLQNMIARENPPGHRFHYTSPLTNILGMIIEAIYQRPFVEVLEEKIYQRIGAHSQAWFNTDGFGIAIAEGQLSLTLQDFARWAMLMINKGKNLNGEQIIPYAFIEDTIAIRASSKQAFNKGITASVYPNGQYRNQFWIIEPELKQYAMLGIHGQTVWYDQNEELMIIGFGSAPDQISALFNESWLQLNLKILDAVKKR
jgi:CubicO group peptidase (beta-lactamase class C family)